MIRLLFLLSEEQKTPYQSWERAYQPSKVQGKYGEYRKSGLFEKETEVVSTKRKEGENWPAPKPEKANDEGHSKKERGKGTGKERYSSKAKGGKEGWLVIGKSLGHNHHAH